MNWKNKTSSIVLILCFLSFFLVACHPKDRTFENIDKIHIAIHNIGALNFEDVDHTITNQTEILKVKELIVSLRKEINSNKYRPAIGASTYYVTFYSKGKVIQEYALFFNSYLTVKDVTGKEVGYYVYNGAEFQASLKQLIR